MFVFVSVFVFVGSNGDSSFFGFFFGLPLGLGSVVLIEGLKTGPLSSALFSFCCCASFFFFSLASLASLVDSRSLSRLSF